MRIEEVAGLQWSDINFESGFLRVNRTIQRICPRNGHKKTEIVFLKPKSATSERIIPFPDFLIEIFRDFKIISEILGHALVVGYIECIFTYEY